MTPNTSRGFTLAEVLVAVAITAVLAAVVVPSVLGQVNKGDKVSVESEVQAVATAVGQYAADTRSLPTSLSSLVDTSLTGWSGPYLSTAQIPVTGGIDYVAAGYGMKYNNVLLASGCTPHNTFVPIAVDTIGGAALGNVPLTDPTFVRFYEDITGAATGPTDAVSSGPIQFTVAGSPKKLQSLFICQIAAKLD